MQWINGVATRLDTYKKDESDEATKARFLAVIVLLRFMEKNELHHFCNDQYAVNLLKLLKLHPKCDTKQYLELDYLREHKDELLR